MPGRGVGAEEREGGHCSLCIAVTVQMQGGNTQRPPVLALYYNADSFRWFVGKVDAHVFLDILLSLFILNLRIKEDINTH
jgi:hypothetical protein